MSKYIFMAYDSGGVKMSESMMKATRDSLVFDFSRNSIYAKENEFGYVGLASQFVNSSDLETKNIVTSVSKKDTGEIFITYTSLMSESYDEWGNPIYAGSEEENQMITGPETYAYVIKNIYQDGLGKITYTYTSINTYHTTLGGVEKTSGSYIINGVSLDKDGNFSYTYHNVTVTDGTKTSGTLTLSNTNKVNVITGIRESADGKISYSYSEINTSTSSVGVEAFGPFVNQVVTNTYLNENGVMSYTYNYLSATTYNNKENATFALKSSDITPTNILDLDSANKSVKVLTGVKLENFGLETRLTYTYSDIYASKNHHSYNPGEKVTESVINYDGTYLINGITISPDGKLSYTYTKVLVNNSTYADKLAYLYGINVEETTTKPSVVELFLDNGYLNFVYTYLNTTTNDYSQNPDVYTYNTETIPVLDNIVQLSNGKITYTYKNIKNVHHNTGTVNSGNKIVTNVNIDSYGNLTYTYYDATTTSGTLTNSIVNYSDHNGTNIAGVAQTKLPLIQSNAVSILTGITQDANGKITYSYGDFWTNPEDYSYTITVLTYTGNNGFSQEDYVAVIDSLILQNSGINAELHEFEYSTTNVPTKKYVDNLLSASDALRYCGTVTASNTANGAITLIYHPDIQSTQFDASNPDNIRGAVYKVTNSGYVGNALVKPGDMIISYVDDNDGGAEVNPPSGWDIINENIDLRQQHISALNSENSSYVLTNIVLNGDGLMTYQYGQTAVLTLETTDDTKYTALQTLNNTIINLNTTNDSTAGVPVITYVNLRKDGLTDVFEFGYSYIYSSQNHHTKTGTKTPTQTQIITNLSIDAAGNFTYSYNDMSVVTYNGNYVQPTITKTDPTNILNPNVGVVENDGYNFITGISIQQHENEISLSYTYTSIYASQSHHYTETGIQQADIQLSASGTYLITNVHLSPTGTLTYSYSNIKVESADEAGTLSQIAAVQIPSYTYSVVSIYKDINNDGVVTYSYVDLTTDSGTKGSNVVIDSDNGINVITSVSQRGDGKISYTYSLLNSESVWERGSGKLSVQTKGTGCIASGAYSVAEGYSTQATQPGALAEGWQTKAQSAYTHAEGLNTIASDRQAHAEGNTTEASGQSAHAEGWNSVASGNNSHAEGESTASGRSAHSEGAGSAGANWSHAEGHGTTSSSSYTHAEGQSTASGSRSHAEGYLTKAQEQNAHSEGESTTASGVNSHAEGNGSTASGAGAHAEGTNTIASGKKSHTENHQTQALGDNTHAEGYRTVAYGSPSHAEGTGTYTVGMGAHAEGYYTYAIGNDSHAEGSHSYAYGDCSHVEGTRTITYNVSENAIGQYNVSNYFEEEEFGYAYNTIHSIGIGYYDEDNEEEVRRNAIEVTQNGDLYIYGIGNYDGTNVETAYDLRSVIIEDELIISYALNDLDYRIDDINYRFDELADQLFMRGTGSLSIKSKDTGTEASGRNAFAVGPENKANADYAVALGYFTNITGNYSGGLGYYNTISGRNSFIAGYSNLISGNYSVAFGATEIVSGSYAFVAGSANNVNASYAFVGGLNNVVQNVSETAFGQYNISSKYNTSFGNAGNTIFSIGIGTSSAPKNAIELMQNGNTYIYGVGNYNGSNINESIPLQKYFENTERTISEALNDLNNRILESETNITNSINVLWERGSTDTSVEVIDANHIAAGEYSLAAGLNNRTLNEAETAFGRYNLSNQENTTFGSEYNTLFSIGIGTSNSVRKNAFEISQDGSLYIYGIGNYNGTNLTQAMSLQELQGKSDTWEKGDGLNSVKQLGNVGTVTGNFGLIAGNNTNATNEAEFAVGKFNISNSGATLADNTAMSLGIGTSDSNRNNAFEVMKNGDFYLTGIGNYDGTNYDSASSLQEYLEDNEIVVSAALNDLNDRLESLEDDIQSLSSGLFQELATTVDSNGNLLLRITIAGETKTTIITPNWGTIS